MVLCVLAYSYRINLIEMVLVIEFTRIENHAVMQTLLSFLKMYLSYCNANFAKFCNNIFNIYRQTEPPRQLDLLGTLIVCHVYTDRSILFKCLSQRHPGTANEIYGYRYFSIVP